MLVFCMVGICVVYIQNYMIKVQMISVSIGVRMEFMDVFFVKLICLVGYQVGLWIKGE